MTEVETLNIYCPFCMAIIVHESQIVGHQHETHLSLVIHKKDP